MRVAFSLVVCVLWASACSEEAPHGGFGEPPRATAIPESPSPSPTTPPAQAASVFATSDLRFNPDTLELKAGRVTEFELRNTDRQDHTLVLDELAVAMLAGAGQTVRTTVAIHRRNTGVYRFFCSIDGHRAAGMEGRIVVT